MEISRQFGTMQSTPSTPLSLFKIRTIWGQIREPAGPKCSCAEISAPWVNTTKFNFHTRFQGCRVVQLCDYMTIEIARPIDKGTQPG